VVSRHFDDLDTVLEFDALNDFRQLIFTLQSSPCFRSGVDKFDRDQDTRQRHRRCISDWLEGALAQPILRCISDWLEGALATQLSERALNWLTANGVITAEQRTNPVAILRCISDWLERVPASSLS
jgi:hypothetical protein